MPYSVSRKIILATALLAFSIISCAPATHLETTACEIEGVSIDCLFDLAEEGLKGIDSGFDYVSSAAELAVAYDSASKVKLANEALAKTVKRSAEISDGKKRAAAIGEILTALSQMSSQDSYGSHIEALSGLALQLPEMSQQADISAKVIVAKAVQQDTKLAFTAALKLPQAESYEANYKAVTLRKIAGVLAKKDDFETANKAIESLTMSIPYYQSVVRSDVAYYVAREGNEVVARTLLNQANNISLTQENGYFSGAGLRDIAYVYAKMDETSLAESYFKQAIEKAATAPKPNERARAVSRIATTMCDLGRDGDSKQVLSKARNLAADIPEGVMQGYSAYEMAGSAAFCGHFDLAREILKTVPNTALGTTESIQSAAKRDLVWGLGRDGQIKEALDVATTIKTGREKVQAYSRLIRVMVNSGMEALPRYL